MNSRKTLEMKQRSIGMALHKVMNKVGMYMMFLQCNTCSMVLYHDSLDVYCDCTME